MEALALLQGWNAGGHVLPGTWHELFARLGVLVLFALYVFLIVRALRRGRWYRAQGVLSAEDLRSVHAELVAAEKRTLGEILLVVLERSDRHPGACWTAALASVLLGSGLLSGYLPWGQPVWILGAQLALGGLGFALARLLPDFQRLFVGAARAQELAEEQAFQEFHRHGLSATEARTGVLLFVSLLERRAIVLADEGIAAQVEPERWTETDDAILSGIRQGKLRDGLIAGIRSAGALLARHFPVQGGDRNEVPDRVIVRAE
jgi:putative membrane protein